MTLSKDPWRCKVPIRIGDFKIWLFFVTLCIVCVFLLSAAISRLSSIRLQIVLHYNISNSILYMFICLRNSFLKITCPIKTLKIKLIFFALKLCDLYAFRLDPSNCIFWDYSIKNGSCHFWIQASVYFESLVFLWCAQGLRTWECSWQINNTF